MLIDKTYFQGDISIPNTTEVNYENDLLQILIESKSSSFLESVLGHENFEDLKDNTDANGNLLPTAEQRWKDLVNGKQYTLNSQHYYFKGLIQSGVLYKTSIIADFVFCEWLRQTRSQASGVGEVVLSAQNAINVNSTSKLVSIWNRFMKEFGDIHYSHCHIHCIKGVPFYDYFNGGNKNYVSLTQFLIHFNEVYIDCPLKLPVYVENHGTINSLGI